MSNEDDIALATLFSLIDTKYPNIDKNLVKRLYDTQKAFQFNPDIVASSQAMKAILEHEIDREADAKG